MNKDVMIAIDAYQGDCWKTVAKDIKYDLRHIGVSAQIIPRNHRYRIRFKCGDDLHLAILAGILERLGEGGRMFNGMIRYRYVKQSH